MRDRLNSFLLKILNPHWVVSEEGDFGIRILGMTLIYYKWDTPLLCENKETYRLINKREFGEVLNIRDFPARNRIV